MATATPAPAKDQIWALRSGTRRVRIVAVSPTRAFCRPELAPGRFAGSQAHRSIPLTRLTTDYRLEAP